MSEDDLDEWTEVDTFEAWHGPTGNLLLWADSLEAIKAKVESHIRNPAGIWIWHKGEGKVFEYHGPLVAP